MPSYLRRSSLMIPLLSGCALLGACGGGGGADAPPTSSTTLRTLGSSISSATTNFNLPDVPRLGMPFELQNVPEEGLVFEISSTGPAIADAHIFQLDATRGSLSLTLEPGTALAPGTYHQDVVMKVCHDDACRFQVAGSPVTFPTTYDVRGNDRLVLASIVNPSQAQAALTDLNGPVASAIVQVTHPPSEGYTVEVDASDMRNSTLVSTEVADAAPFKRVDFQLARPREAGQGTFSIKASATACFDTSCRRVIPTESLPIAFSYRVTSFPVLASTKLEIPAAEILWEPLSARILYIEAKDPSDTEADDFLDLAAIEPVTGSVTPMAYLPFEPRLMAMTSDSQYLYVSQRFTPLIHQIRMSDYAHTGIINLASVAGNADIYASSMLTSPGPGSVLAVRTSGSLPTVPTDAVRLFDGLVQRPTILEAKNVGALTWDGDGSNLYGIASERSGADPLRGAVKLAVSANGLTLADQYGRIAALAESKLQFNQDRLFASGGQVFDLNTRTSLPDLGNSETRGLSLAIDEDLGRAFYLQHSYSDLGGYLRITAYDLETLEDLGSVLVEGRSGPGKLIRWGDRGLAILDPKESITVLESGFVDGSSSDFASN